ncbi:hypothetical protein ACFL4L_01030 [bacterium]
MDCQRTASEMDVSYQSRFEFPDSVNLHQFSPTSIGNNVTNTQYPWTQSTMSTQLITFSNQ